MLEGEGRRGLIRLPVVIALVVVPPEVAPLVLVRPLPRYLDREKEAVVEEEALLENDDLLDILHPHNHLLLHLHRFHRPDLPAVNLQLLHLLGLPSTQDHRHLPVYHHPRVITVGLVVHRQNLLLRTLHIEGVQKTPQLEPHHQKHNLRIH